MELTVVGYLTMVIIFLFWVLVFEPFYLPVARNYMAGSGFNLVVPERRIVTLEAFVRFPAFVALMFIFQAVSRKCDKYVI